MKATFYLFSGLVLLASCTSPTEQLGLKAVADFYGGDVLLKKGSNVSTNTKEAQGKYLEINLTNSKLSKQFDDLSIPASNCVYLAYNLLSPEEQQSYAYFKIILQDSSSTHTYTYKQPELRLAQQAVNDLNTLMANIQQQEYLAAANTFNPAALGNTPLDSLPTMLTQFGKQLQPFNDYTLHGFGIIHPVVNGKSLDLVRLLVVVPHPQKPIHFTAIIDPRKNSNQKFLYGLQ